ncbi:reverse transcriptase domain-containing protein [Tanacetum coccineum]
MGGKMTSEVTLSKEINETGINKNEPPRFEQDVHEEPHDDGVENKSSNIRERTTQPLVKPQQSSVPFPNQFTENKSRLEEACTEIMNERGSAVLLNELPSKEKDPRSFTTPCQVFEKPKKAEDLVTNHLSRFQNPHMNVLTEREITDKFFDEHLMVLKSKFNNDEPWNANFVNYIVGKRGCVAGSETLEILAHCHSGPTGGDHSANITAKKETYLQGTKGLKITFTVCEVFNVWGLDFMGPFPNLEVIYIAIDYVSKWIEAKALPTNDARVVVKFLKSLFARFGVPKALISD